MEHLDVTCNQQDEQYKSLLLPPANEVVGR